MSLFSIVATLNKEIDANLNEVSGEDKEHRLVEARTDGNTTVILFCNSVMWDSSDWPEAPNTKMMTDEEFQSFELVRIESAVRTAINKYLERLYNIQIRY